MPKVYILYIVLILWECLLHTSSNQGRTQETAAEFVVVQPCNVVSGGVVRQKEPALFFFHYVTILLILIIIMNDNNNNNNE